MERAEIINARLIAMAPDFAAALIKAEEALDLITKEDRLHGVTPGSNGHQSWHDGYCAAIARAALSEIKKLRGE